jgi:uncharacterized repeat protein (TIGR03803 family)
VGLLGHGAKIEILAKPELYYERKIMKTRFAIRLFGAVNVALAFTTLAAMMVVSASSAHAQNFKSLYSFANPPDGAAPYGGVIKDKSGNFYGTTSVGGASGFGTVYKLDKNGKDSVLYSFTGGADGSQPIGGLVMDDAGILYGTTSTGGSSDAGTVFEVNPHTKTETVLYTFTGTPDGTTPFSGLLMDKSGNLYGTTFAGGSSDAGTVYKVNIQTKQETVLHSFSGDPDGGGPVYGNLLMDKSGNLYGTTDGGGSFNSGSVWELSANGTETVLYSFTGGKDGGGGGADQSLVMDDKGNLYGITERGGVGEGVVYRVNIKTKRETVLYTFQGFTHGAIPTCGLARDSKGNLYGTTASSANGDGTVFELTGRKETVLHRFHGVDGESPYGSPLLLDGDTLYGVTYLGGAKGHGTVFSVKP